MGEINAHSFLRSLQEDTLHLTVPKLGRSFCELNKTAEQKEGFKNKQYMPRHKSLFYKK